MRKPYSTEEIARLIDLRRKGYSLDDIRQLTGMSLNTISRHTSGFAPIKPQAKDAPCSIEGCSQPCRCSGLCAKHYRDWAKNKSTPADFERVRARLLKDSKVTETGCREWQGSILISKVNNLPYGRYAALGETLVHRVSYLAFNGPIPEGLQIDHTCSNTICMEPMHLEAVPAKENVRRTFARGRGQNRSKMNSNNALEFWKWVTAV